MTNGASAELKAAARAILLLCDDVATFSSNGTLASPSRGRAQEPGSNAGGRRSFVGRRSISEVVAGLRRAHPLALLALVIPLAVLAIAFLIARAVAPDLDPKGPGDGELVNAPALGGLEFSIAGDASTLEDGHWTLDGKDVTGVRLADDRVVYRPDKLADGSHAVEVSFSGVAPWSTGTATWSFTVDTVAPTIQVTKSSLSAPVRSPYRLEGVAETAATLTVDGRPVELKNGRFVLPLDEAPGSPLELEVRDAAGNAALSTLAVSLVPREPKQPIRAVHMSADAWANDELRGGVLDLIEQKRINAVELDLKDESGVIGWDAPVPLGRQIGAVRDIYDLGAAVKQLHAKGVRVIGRLVAFRDPILAEAAWTGGQRKEVIQTPDGGPYAGYGGFTNFANATVRQYNIDVATAAAALGVDDILYDYVRRPDGPLDSMVFPGLEGSIDDAIVAFLAETRRGARTARDVSRGLGLRHRRHAPRGDCARTFRRWPARSTTSHRWSTRRTGGRVSTASRIRSRTPTTSSRARSRTSRRPSRARAPASSRGFRTSPCAFPTVQTRCGRRSRPPRTTGSASSCSGIPR